MAHDPKCEHWAAQTPATAACTADIACAAPSFETLYAQLRHLARRQLGAAPRTTLCTTALVHEAWLKLGNAKADAGQRGAFLALAAKTMRHVLIDHVRECNAAKRGGGVRAITLDTDVALSRGGDEVDLLAIEQGLTMLERLDPRLVSVVECHFFAGMDFAEIGSVLALSERTVQRDWRRARAFLQAQLADARS
ncbi:MAG TPA: ECF-type sigma factor [Rhodanobacteraceae bacterium]|nr:ECF-type sigma factor [Rhodanobacteraceae bacterium]